MLPLQGEEAQPPPSATTPKRHRETSAHEPNSSCKKVLFGPSRKTLSGGDSAGGEQAWQQPDRTCQTTSTRGGTVAASDSIDPFDDGLDALLMQIPMPATKATPADPTAVATPPAATKPAAGTLTAAMPAATPKKQCDIRGFLTPRARAMVDSDSERELKAEIEAAQAIAKAARVSAAQSARATVEQVAGEAVIEIVAPAAAEVTAAVAEAAEGVEVEEAEEAADSVAAGGVDAVAVAEAVTEIEEETGDSTTEREGEGGVEFHCGIIGTEGDTEDEGESEGGRDGEDDTEDETEG